MRSIVARPDLPARESWWSAAYALTVEGQLAELVRNLRQVLLDHPAAAQLLPGSVPFGPHGLALAGHITSTLRRADFTASSPARGYVTLLFYVGFATQQLAFGRGAPGWARLTEISEFLPSTPTNNRRFPPT